MQTSDLNVNNSESDYANAIFRQFQDAIFSREHTSVKTLTKIIFDLLQWQEIATLSLLKKATIASLIWTTFRRHFRLGANDITRNRSRVIFSRACADIFCRWRTFSIWSIDSCQNRIATDQYPMTIWRAHVSTHGGDVIYLEAVRWPVNCFTRSRTMFNLILLLVWEHRKLIMHTYWTSMFWSIDSCQNRVPADQYHLTVSRAQVSTHRVQVFFWSYPLTSY